jgi:hypothetical protein
MENEEIVETDSNHDGSNSNGIANTLMVDILQNIDCE